LKQGATVDLEADVGDVERMARGDAQIAPISLQTVRFHECRRPCNEHEPVHRFGQELARVTRGAAVLRLLRKRERAFCQASSIHQTGCFQGDELGGLDHQRRLADIALSDL
jgi:hypothetical protein